MNKIVLVIVFMFSLSIYSQQRTDEVNYSASLMEMVLLKGDKVILKKPFGSGLEIVFDNYFKSYYITYYDEYGTFAYMRLSFLSKEVSERGTIIYKMHDQRDNLWTLVDQIEMQNQLVIMMNKKVEGNDAILLITNVVRQN